MASIVIMIGIRTIEAPSSGFGALQSLSCSIVAVGRVVRIRQHHRANSVSDSFDCVNMCAVIV